MPIRLSIRKKGLLIVAVPLLFQFIFVAVLMKELARAEQETLDEVHAREIISAVDRLFVHAYEASGALYMYAYTQNEFTSDKFDSSIKDINNDLRFLKENSRHDEKVFGYLNGEMQSGIAALRDQKRLINEGQHVGDNVQRMTGYNRVRKIIHTARALAGVELAAHGKAARSFEERRNAIRQVMLVGLVGNLLIAFWIANFFARNIEQRLKRVLSNVDLFSKRKPLLPPLMVTDEIGSVDKAFHDMAENVSRAEKIKQDFVAMIGHDIRTPATTIKTTLDLLDEEAADKLEPELRELVANATGESRRLMTLTNNLLDLPQIELGQFQIDSRSINIADCIRQSLRSLSLYAQSKKTTISAEPREIQVIADPDRIVQVLVNLLSNAVKYSPKGSKVKVDVLESGDFVEVVVADNGPGIPDQYIEKIFETYERLNVSSDEEPHGMGLGLAICKTIITAHGGTIGVRKSAVGGSEFWFKLPTCDGTN